MASIELLNTILVVGDLKNRLSATKGENQKKPRGCFLCQSEAKKRHSWVLNQKPAGGF